MLLSEFKGCFFHVIRNGVFYKLGILVSEPNEPYLCFAESESFLNSACAKQDISCILCTQELADMPVARESGKAIAVTDHPRAVFYQLHNYLAKNSSEYAMKSWTTQVGKDCAIHPSAMIASEGVKIGERVVIEEYAVIRPGTEIGDDTVIRAGAVVGGSNQIVNRDQNGNLFLAEQAGGVIIGAHCEVGYHALIARGMFPYEMTRLGEHCIIDASCTISHNNQIGNNVMVLGQSQICGSCVLEDNVRVSPQAIVSNCLHVGEGATVSIGAVVAGNVKKGKKVSGNFAIDHDKFLLWHRNKLRAK